MKYINMTFLFSVLLTSVFAKSEVSLSNYQTDELSTENSVSIYVIHSPNGIDWSSASSLVKSTMNNSFSYVGYYTDKKGQIVDKSFSGDKYFAQLKNHPISHMAISIHCEGEPALYTGMTTGDDFEAPFDMFLNGLGLGILLKTQLGALEKGPSLKKEIELRKKYVGNIAQMKLKINDHQCRAVNTYLKDYIARDNDKKYGSLKDQPLKDEGAGCAAFAFSFLKVLNLIPLNDENINENHFSNDWRRHLEISENYIGNAAKNAPIGVIGLWKSSQIHPWVIPYTKSISIDFWDPELFFDWIVQASQGNKNIPYISMSHNGLNELSSYQITNISEDHMHSIQIDLSNNPTNLSPIWQK